MAAPDRRSLMSISRRSRDGARRWARRTVPCVTDPGVEVYNKYTTTGDSAAINHSQASLNRAELQKCLWKLGIKRQKGCLLR